MYTPCRNETLEDDYSDLEKALALYEYFANTYTYDYESAAYDGYPEWLSSYRVFNTGTGICQEFSVAYAYLLMQAGVEATNMSGFRSYDGELHQWTYVRINGHNYHIGKNAFNGCNALKTVTVKTELLTNDNVGKAAFKGINKKATFKCPKDKLKKGAPKGCKFK